jgi:hypothetical protein
MTPYEQQLIDDYQQFAAGRFLNRLLDELDEHSSKQEIRLMGMRLLSELPYHIKEQKLSSNITLHTLPALQDKLNAMEPRRLYRNPAMSGFRAGTEARKAVGETDICAVD